MWGRAPAPDLTNWWPRGTETLVPDGQDLGLGLAGWLRPLPTHTQPSLQVDMEGNEQDQDQWMI